MHRVVHGPARGGPPANGRPGRVRPRPRPAAATPGRARLSRGRHGDRGRRRKTGRGRRHERIFISLWGNPDPQMLGYPALTIMVKKSNLKIKLMVNLVTYTVGELLFMKSFVTAASAALAQWRYSRGNRCSDDSVRQ